jgi:GDP-mannose 4,6-dehydratase
MKRLLITGYNGVIAKYVEQRFKDEYDIYGIGRNVEPSDRVCKCDMNDTIQLEKLIRFIQPAAIVHLASISDTHYAFQNPVETLTTNGLVVAHLCDIIHKNNWNIKLFNASSSEMYKGHQKYVVEDDDTHRNHCHPYSIAKIMSHSIVDFYRMTHGCPFSNGIIFTTESRDRKPTFLLSKIAHYIRSWTLGSPPLVVGPLDSYRNILHASDVADAIWTILQQDTGNSYVVCNDETQQVLTMVMTLFSQAGMPVVHRENTLYYLDEPILHIRPNLFASLDNGATNIDGKATLLKSLGWRPKYTIDQTLQMAYGKPDAVFLSHNGLGDNLFSIGALRFLLQYYQTIRFLCKDRYYENVRLFFADEPRIICVPFDSDNEFAECRRIVSETPTDDDILVSGIHKTYINPRITAFTYMPDCNRIYDLNFDTLSDMNYDFLRLFYTDIGLDLRIFYEYFHLGSTEISQQLYNSVSHYKTIIFLQTKSSNGIQLNIERLRTQYLNDETSILISNNENLYDETDVRHQLCSPFVLNKIVHYIDLIRNCHQIYIIDSCMTGIVLPLVKTGKLAATTVRIIQRDLVMNETI